MFNYCSQRRTVQLWVHRYADTGSIDPRRPGPIAGLAYKDAIANARHRDVVTRHMAEPFLSTRSTVTKHEVTLKTVRNHLRAAA